MAILDYVRDRFAGASLSPLTHIDDPRRWEDDLDETIGYLRENGAKLIWLNLPPALSILVDPAVSRGFAYHHAEEGNLQLVLALHPDAHIPAYATHYIGAGGVVIDKQKRILVVQERFRRQRRHWKLPGGALDKREHISEAVMREVLEETGIRTEFISLTGFRHWHGYRYGKSDIYFICRLKPLNSDIVLDTSEIEEARWMPVTEYLNDEDTHPFNRTIVETAISSRGMKRRSLPGYGTPETHELFFEDFS